MTTDINLFSIQTEAQLSEAWLIYTRKGKPLHLARHTIEKGEIAGSLPVSKSALIDAFSALSGNNNDEIVVWPETLLSSRPIANEYVWYRPRSLALTRFDCEELGCKEAWIELPTLVFHTHMSSMSVCAVAGNSRPNANTPIFHSALFNTYDNGSICLGEVNVPYIHTPKDLLLAESLLLNASNTHPNTHEVSSRHKNGLFAMWAQLLKNGGSLKTQWLAPMRQFSHLGQWLNRK
jgi:PRTRC genetic system protein B